MTGSVDTVAVTTGHGIRAGHQVAGIGARSYAFLIDWHVRALLALGWWLACVAGLWTLEQFGLTLDPGESLLWFMLLPAAAVYLLYHPVLEVLRDGSTPGKRMTGVRVVRLDGGRAGAGQHLVRNVFRLLDSMPGFYCVGIVCCLLTRQQVRTGDLAAGTVLVYDEHRSAALEAVIARELAADREGARLAAIASQLLARWSTLDRLRRRQLAAQLLRQAGEAVAGEAADAHWHDALSRLVAAHEADDGRR